MSALGDAVRLRRLERGLGQEELAAALGVRQQTVSRWEHGLALPRPARVVDLARLLDLEPAALHRLAGYLPPEHVPWDERLSELSRPDLVRLVERARAELRSRDARDPAPHDEAAAG